MEDPLEATLVGCRATNSHSGEKEEYSTFLNEPAAYMPRQSRRGVLSVQESTFKKEVPTNSRAKTSTFPSQV